MSTPPQLIWSTELHRDILVDLFRGLHEASRKLNRVECVALAVLSLAQTNQSATVDATMTYIAQHIYLRSLDREHAASSVPAFDQQNYAGLVSPVIKALHSDNPTGVLQELVAASS